MQVFIGGAYNGKTDYVMREHEGQAIFIADGLLPEHVPPFEVVVIKNLDKWLVTQNLESDELIIEKILTRIRVLEENCQLSIIVTDMGRGVVPIDRQARLLRDTCGRLYQQLFKEANRVVRIWYGIGEELK